MIVHFALMLFSRLRALPWSQRRAVWRRCVRPWLTRWQVVSSKLVLLVLIIAVGQFFMAFSAGWRPGFLPLIVFFLADEVLDLALVIHYWPRILACLSTSASLPSSAA